MKLFNFLFFWMLTTFAISRADVVGLILSVLGFLVMHTIIEDSIENNE